MKLKNGTIIYNYIEDWTTINNIEDVNENILAKIEVLEKKMKEIN